MEIKPMLASIGTEEILERKDFYFEPKLDGIRALCYKKTKLKFTSRNGINITKEYPEFDFFDSIDAEECILDGEIVVYDEKGHPSFELWHNNRDEYQATYVVFDILYHNGKSLLNEPLYVRKKILDKIIKAHDHLQFSVYTKNGKKLWNIMKERKLEGVVAKKDDSSYEIGVRSDAWKKIKIINDIDCVIIGYTSEKRKISSLALGLYEKGELIFAGKVGTGFDEEMMNHLKEKLDEMTLDESLIETEKGVIPVQPLLVAQITFLEITKNKKLRAPVFVRIREDKDPEECIL
jgi:bifunctional non-homologous end joining protein LigD